MSWFTFGISALLGLFLAYVIVGIILITKNESQRPLMEKITELQTNVNYDPAVIRDILNNSDPNITLEELIESSQTVEKIYKSYIIKKYNENAVLSFPATYFFDSNGNLISGGSAGSSSGASLSLMEAGNPTTEGVEFMVSSTFGENITVNISICGKVQGFNELVFVADLNIHSRNQAQGIMVCNGIGSKFITLCITPYFDTFDNKLKSKIQIHPQGESGSIFLETGTEFYILSSYKVYNENITSTDVNLDSYVMTQGTSYCR